MSKSNHSASSAQGQVGVLLCNLGTPEAPTAEAVKRYLAEFLGDRRVVEIPPPLWQPILHGVILRRRPAESAQKYQMVWMEEGSPLLVWSKKQQSLLRGYLGERGRHAQVELAMRYGQPSVGSRLDALVARGCSRILVVPLYPQYSATTTGSVMDAVTTWMRQQRHVPEFRFIGQFHDDPAYIEALAQSVLTQWQNQPRGDKLVMSFHGLPQRMVDRGDPYLAQCAATAQALAERLELSPDSWQLTFQSRFGRAKWIGPPTQPTLEKLAQSGTRHVDVICPGFVSDCLETLEEIAITAKEAFVAAGGQTLNYIPCLNDDVTWMRGLTALVERHLQGWQPIRPMP